MSSADSRRSEPPAGFRVLITAGARGIGNTMVKTFLAAGARVHTCDIDAAALAECRASLPEVSATRADVSSVDDVDRLFQEAREHLGGLDVLVNNAGIAGPTAEVENISPAEWIETMQVNINGQFFCVRRAVPLLKEAGGGVIVNVSSVAGRLGFALRTPYAASKWAVIGFTRSLAKELGPHNIRVNAILPGLVKGPRLEKVLRTRAEAEKVPYEEMEERYVQHVALRRMVSQDDVAGMALFLCSPAAANITGQSLSVCGDLESI